MAEAALGSGPTTGRDARAVCQRRAARDCRRVVEFLGLPGERIPLADASIDTAVSIFTLCTIPGVEEALQGVRSVLKRQGRHDLLRDRRLPVG